MTQTATEPKSKRQAQADARREQLLNLGLQLFAEKGIRGTTMKDLAAAAGVAEGLIYHYFPSKGALVQAVIESRNIADEIVTLLTSLRDIPAREAYVSFGLQVLEILARNRPFVMMVHAEAGRDAEVAAALGRVMSGGLELAHQSLRRRIETGELRAHDPWVSLCMFRGSLFWYFQMQEYLSPPLPAIDRETYVRGVVDVLLNGITSEGAR